MQVFSKTELSWPMRYITCSMHTAFAEQNFLTHRSHKSQSKDALQKHSDSLQKQGSAIHRARAEKRVRGMFPYGPHFASH